MKYGEWFGAALAGSDPGAFVPRKKLHERMTAALLADGQMFVKGADLKADLARLDVHHSALPDDVKNRGVISFAHSPPSDGGFLVSELWDRLRPADDASSQGLKRPAGPMSAAAQKAYIEEVGSIVDASPEQPSDLAIEDADMIVMKHTVPVFKGKWRLVPPEAVGKPGRGSG